MVRTIAPTKSESGSVTSSEAAVIPNVSHVKLKFAFTPIMEMSASVELRMSGETPSSVVFV